MTATSIIHDVLVLLVLCYWSHRNLKLLREVISALESIDRDLAEEIRRDQLILEKLKLKKSKPIKPTKKR